MPAPILARHRLPATCFVATEGLDGSHVFWWDRLAVLLLGDGARPDELLLEPAGWPAPAGDGDTGERLFAHGLVYHAIVALPAAARDAVLAQIAAWAPDVACDPDSAEGCRLDELRDLAGHGISIGAHTVDHPQLPTQDRATQVRQMADSRVALERITGAPVTRPGVPLRRLRRDDDRGGRRGGLHARLHVRAAGAHGRRRSAATSASRSAGTRRWIGSPRASCWRSTPAHGWSAQ